MLRVGPLTIGHAFGRLCRARRVTFGRRGTKASAPISDVLVSYMQQHIRGYYGKGKVTSTTAVDGRRCQQPGQCDIRAANYVINAHLRRHDTYRSWFQYTTAIDNPAYDPGSRRHRVRTRAPLPSRAANSARSCTPDPRNGAVPVWDRKAATISHFCKCGSCACGRDDRRRHAHGVPPDVRSAGGRPCLRELPPAGSYDDFCRRQHTFSSTIGGVAQVRAWTRFAEGTNGSFPDFPPHLVTHRTQ